MPSAHPCDDGGHGCDSSSSYCVLIDGEPSCAASSTSYADHGSGQLRYLDRQDVSCGNNGFLSRTQLRTSGANVKYDFTCCTVPGASDAVCTSQTTALSDEGPGHVRYLDRHNMQLGPPRQLTSPSKCEGFQLWLKHLRTWRRVER